MLIPNIVLFAAFFSTVFGYNNTVYLIRHAEKPKHGNGLSRLGQQRAECLVDLFSDKDIGYIIAQRPRSTGSRIRSLLTVEPLAKKLEIKVDTSCKRDDPQCVAAAVHRFTQHNNSNILIAWQHGWLTNIAKELGIRKVVKVDRKDWDLIWTLRHSRLVSITSQRCPGLDDAVLPIEHTSDTENVLVEQV